MLTYGFFLAFLFSLFRFLNQTWNVPIFTNSVWKCDAKTRLESFVGKMVGLTVLMYYVVVTADFKNREPFFAFLDVFTTARNVEKMGAQSVVVQIIMRIDYRPSLATVNTPIRYFIGC